MNTMSAPQPRLGKWKLSPSDFAFLWEECRRCFYLKVVEGFRRPSTPIPKIFSTIDGLMKQAMAGKRTEEVLPALPRGQFQYAEMWVESGPLVVPGYTATCFIRGKFDTVIHFDDATYGVVDFKTSSRNAEHIPLYGRQLHGYLQALENPAPGRLALKPISRLGLLVFDPSVFSCESGGAGNLSGSISWMEVERDDAGFQKFLGEVLGVLEKPTPPGGSAHCDYCAYRDTSRRTAL